MFKTKLRELRKQNGYSQQRLADELNISQSTVAMWESGKNTPEYNSLLRIASLFSVSTDYLTGQSSGKSPFRIPVLGYVRAGVPTEAVEEILDYEDVFLKESEIGEVFALRIKGDSMSPRMMDGDTVIVKKQSAFTSGDICVALVGSGDATVKKIIKKDKGIILMPLNANYEPLVFSSSEVETIPISIIGKVTELRARL